MTDDASGADSSGTPGDPDGDPTRSEEAPTDPSAEDRGDPDDAGETSSQRPRKKRKHLPVWQESLLLLAVALVLAVVIKALFVQAFYIPSESMEPGLVENDRILVQKVSYWFGRDPERGDVVVFKDPGGWLTGTEPAPTGMAKVLSKVGLYPTGGHLVKRVIATEGDTIRCCDKQGRLRINGEPVDESSYLSEERGTCAGEGVGWSCNWTAGPVPEGKMFVMGDNRLHSADSRAHLCRPKAESCTKSPWVDADLVVGKVFALVWPQDRWTWVSNPGAFDEVPEEAAE